MADRITALRLERNSTHPFNRLVEARDGGARDSLGLHGLGLVLSLLLFLADANTGYCQSIISLQPNQATASQGREPSSAEYSLRAKLRAGPFDGANARALAALLEQTGRVNAALALRRAILANAVGAADVSQARMELATAMVEANQSKEALPLLQSIVAAEQLNEPAQFELGTAFARTHDFKSAASAFAMAVQLNPSDAEAQLSAAKALVTLLLFAEAEPYLEAAGHRKTSSAEIPALRGMIYSHTGRSEQAVPQLRASIALDPTNADVQLQLGQTLLQKRQFQDALSPFLQAIAIQPSVAAYFSLSRAYRGLGDAVHADEAVRSLRALQARQVGDTKIEVLRKSAEQALAEKEYLRAVEAYKAAVALRPDDGDLVYRLALARGQAGQYDMELSLLKQALTLAPRSAGALSELGTLQAMKGERTTAERTLRQALQIDPQRADALTNLAVLIAQSGDLTGAEGLLTDAIESSPSYVSAYRSLGLVYAAQGHSTEAEAALRKSIALDPKDALSEIALGQLYLENHRNFEAMIALQVAIKLAPANREIISLMNKLCTMPNLDQSTRDLCTARPAAVL